MDLSYLEIQVILRKYSILNFLKSGQTALNQPPLKRLL